MRGRGSFRAPAAAAAAATNATHLLLPFALAPLQINAKISKTTHLKEMNFEIEKLKQMLIATREKNGAPWRRCGRVLSMVARAVRGTRLVVRANASFLCAGA